MTIKTHTGHTRSHTLSSLSQKHIVILEKYKIYVEPISLIKTLVKKIIDWLTQGTEWDYNIKDSKVLYGIVKINEKFANKQTKRFATILSDKNN